MFAYKAYIFSKRYRTNKIMLISHRERKCVIGCLMKEGEFTFLDVTVIYSKYKSNTILR